MAIRPGERQWAALDQHLDQLLELPSAARPPALASLEAQQRVSPRPWVRQIEVDSQGFLTISLLSCGRAGAVAQA
jgi:hypothetical protein